jgi:hypothetical protein
VFGALSELLAALMKRSHRLARLAQHSFAPVENAEEIAHIPAGIKVITVATLAQAISYLERTAVSTS